MSWAMEIAIRTAREVSETPDQAGEAPVLTAVLVVTSQVDVGLSVTSRLEGFSNEDFAESLYEVLSAKLHELTGARLPPVVGQKISGQGTGGLKS